MRILLVLLLAATPALAQRSAGALVKVGDDAFAHGFYDDAAGAYRDAYRMGGGATLLLKIGSCEERLQRWGEAAESYRRYLAEDATLSPGERGNLESKVASLEARAHPPAASPAPAPPPPPPAPLAAPPEGAHVVGLRRAVVGTAIATTVVALTAGAVTIGAADRFKELNADCRSFGNGCSGSARERVSALDHAADSLWALAAAGAVSTLTLHLVLRHQRKLHAAIAPTMSGARATLGGEF